MALSNIRSGHIPLDCQVPLQYSSPPKKRVFISLFHQLLEILVCPKCKGEIYLNEAGDGLMFEACKLVNEIKGDIPIMLIGEAKLLGK